MKGGGGGVEGWRGGDTKGGVCGPPPARSAEVGDNEYACMRNALFAAIPDICVRKFSARVLCNRPKGGRGCKPPPPPSVR